ncbi:hypothetical protein T552_02373 [Pneumocystis carinii B80]|uniref:Coatomer subunit delta n=1 Tax=Pneumocystis carinii (strain B80) TaxID=1408658 RepID=A0A0W4ZG93_PNEC8|nr:hypothetical protein T552_02373 [Pneumocystis carinii B80]KTW27394.1 hypothetical protein T552_02373 [Pneumocystis carinii B80]
MVILAASICTRGGKTILSRQFRDIPKARIEKLLATFPQLANTGIQHTTIETDYIRYVYQPLEELYMILITNIHSNILQDINTLHLFTETVINICHSCDEREILHNAFELLNAFDEITSYGYRENLSFAQIKSFLEMDSHEEKIQEIIAKNKELEAGEERKRRAKQFELQRKESSKKGFNNFQSLSSNQYQSVSQSLQNMNLFHNIQDIGKKQVDKSVTLKGKGMQLSKKPKQIDNYENTKQSKNLKEHLFSDVSMKQCNIKGDEFENIQIKLFEDIHIIKTKDNGFESIEIKGDLHLRILQPDAAFFRIFLCDNEEEKIQYKTHPNIDKSQFLLNKVIVHRNLTKPFPVNNSLSLLKWKIIKKKENIIFPLTVNLWTCKNNEHIEMNIEYELTSNEYEFQNVLISIPLQSYSTVLETTDEIIINHEKKSLEWFIPEINSFNQSDSKKITLENNSDTESFFPVSINFNIKTLLFNIDVIKAELINEEKEVSFSKSIISSGDIIIK